MKYRSYRYPGFPGGRAFRPQFYYLRTQAGDKRPLRRPRTQGWCFNPDAPVIDRRRFQGGKAYRAPGDSTLEAVRDGSEVPVISALPFIAGGAIEGFPVESDIEYFIIRQL